jgi:hypothetical protein
MLAPDFAFGFIRATLASAGEGLAIHDRRHRSVARGEGGWMGMVNRFATFMLLGPLLAWLSTSVLLLPGPIPPDGAELAFYVVVLLFVVVFGLTPGAVLAGADQVMVKLGWSRVWRAVACAVLAYPLAALAIWTALRSIGLHSYANEVPVNALFGVIPAAVCSWLSGRWEKGK